MLSWKFIALFFVSCVCLKADVCWNWMSSDGYSTTKQNTFHTWCRLNADENFCILDQYGNRYGPIDNSKHHAIQPAGNTWELICEGDLCTDNLKLYQYDSSVPKRAITLLRACLERFYEARHLPKPNFSGLTTKATTTIGFPVETEFNDLCWTWKSSHPQSVQKQRAHYTVCRVLAKENFCLLDPHGQRFGFDGNQKQHEIQSFGDDGWALFCRGDLCTDNLEFYQYNSSVPKRAITLLRACLKRFYEARHLPKPHFPAIATTATTTVGTTARTTPRSETDGCWAWSSNNPKVMRIVRDEYNVCRMRVQEENLCILETLSRTGFSGSQNQYEIAPVGHNVNGWTLTCQGHLCTDNLRFYQYDSSVPKRAITLLRVCLTKFYGVRNLPKPHFPAITTKDTTTIRSPVESTPKTEECWKWSYNEPAAPIREEKQDYTVCKMRVQESPANFCQLDAWGFFTTDDKLRDNQTQYDILPHPPKNTYFWTLRCKGHLCTDNLEFYQYNPSVPNRIMNLFRACLARVYEARHLPQPDFTAIATTATTTIETPAKTETDECWDWYGSNPRMVRREYSHDSVCEMEVQEIPENFCLLRATGHSQLIDDSEQYVILPSGYKNSTWKLICKGHFCTDNLDFYQYNSTVSKRAITLLRACLERFYEARNLPKPDSTGSTNSPCGVNSSSEATVSSADLNGSILVYFISLFLCGMFL